LSVHQKYIYKLTLPLALRSLKFGPRSRDQKMNSPKSKKKKTSWNRGG